MTDPTTYLRSKAIIEAGINDGAGWIKRAADDPIGRQFLGYLNECLEAGDVAPFIHMMNSDDDSEMAKVNAALINFMTIGFAKCCHKAFEDELGDVSQN